jgi:hypothetical protein
MRKKMSKQWHRVVSGELEPFQRNPLREEEMFGLFKKKSEVERLQDEFKKLSEESFRLSRSNRRESDKKAEEADEVMKRIEALQAQA